MTRHSCPTRTLQIAAIAATAGLLLSGCARPEDQTAAEPAHFENVDELYDAVDEQLDCPEGPNTDYGFDMGEESGVLSGRSCANSVVMAFSEDEAVISDIHEMMTTAQGGTLYIAHNANWLVADITEVAGDGQATDLAHPGSRDLESLAAAFGGDYIEH